MWLRNILAFMLVKTTRTFIFMSLLVNDLVLWNCMLDSGALNNIMPYGMMKLLGLKVKRPYQNAYPVDSWKVKVEGLIKDLHIQLIKDILRESYCNRLAVCPNFFLSNLGIFPTSHQFLQLYCTALPQPQGLDQPVLATTGLRLFA